MVPMVFVYAPTILLVLPEYFTWTSFIQVSVTCAFGVFAIATAVSGFFLAPLNAGWRFLMGVAGLLLVAPSWESDLAALAVAAPVVLMQVAASRRETAGATAGDSG
jgi:TRAP-type uncharacterized transport system fused permease subunit